MKHTILPAITGVLALSLLASGCSTDSGGGDSATINAQLGWQFNTEYGAWCAAQENGYWTDQGISMNITPGGVNAVKGEQAIAGGSADVATVSSQSAITAMNSGADIVILGATYQRSTNAVISLPDDPVDSLAKLQNKKFGVNPAQAVQYANAMEKQDLGSFKAVSTADPDALVNGEIDALNGSINNQAIILEEAGENPVVTSMEDLGFHDYGQVLVTSRSYLEGNRDNVVKFLAGLVEGARFYIDNPDEVADLTVNNCGKDLALDPVIAEKQAESWPQFMTAGDAEERGLLSIDLDYMDSQVLPVLRDFVGVDTIPEAKDAVDLSPLEEAHELVAGE